MFRSLCSALFFKLEDFRLNLHFTRVIRLLGNDQTTETLTPDQQNKRRVLLDRLRRYRKNNFFPRNSYGGAPKPCFFDAEQRACAVADLLIQSGQTEFAEEIAGWDNHALVRDMHFPQLLRWAEQNGVSQRDLALIQPQYFEPSLQGLALVILSCANLLLLLLYGNRNVAVTLLGLGFSVFLFWLTLFF